MVELMSEVNTCAADYMAECHVLQRDLNAVRSIAEQAVTLALSGRIPATYVVKHGIETPAEHWLESAKRYLGGDKHALDFTLQPPDDTHER